MTSKKQVLTAIFFAAIFINQLAVADVGIGVSATSDEAWIYFPVNISPSLRVEPAFRYGKDEEVESFGDEKIEFFELSFGLFGRKKADNDVGIYYGARLSYIKREAEQKSDFSSFHEETKGYRISPTLGVEYFITKSFSLGAEAEWYYFDLDGEERNDNNKFDLENKRTGSGSRMLVRYIF